MIKFRVGDKVRVRKDAPKNNWVASMDEYINRVMTVDDIFSDGVGVVENVWKWNFENIELSEETIVIYRKENNTFGILKRDGKEVKRSSAECSPEDTYSLETGARLVIERLFAPEPYNHKLVCTRGAGHFRMGKLYEVKDGILYGDVGYETGIGFCPPYILFTNLDEVNKEMASKFIEYVEE